MRQIARGLGGRPETVHGLAGIGDLDVTAHSGRNRAFGEQLGRGETVRAAHQAMLDAGLTIEGLAVAGLADGSSLNGSVTRRWRHFHCWMS